MNGLIRGRDIQPDDALDRIYKAWINHTIEEDLSFADLQILERMEFIDARLREGGERARFKNVVEETYQEFNKVDKAITRRTIETDISRTKRFFLSVRPRTDKEYAKGMHIEWGLKKLAQLDERKKDKEWNALYKELGELQGFKDRDIEKPDYAAVQPPPVMVILDPTVLGAPAIDNLEEEIRLLNLPKKQGKKTDQFDDAEEMDDDE